MVNEIRMNEHELNEHLLLQAFDNRHDHHSNPNHNRYPRYHSHRVSYSQQQQQQQQQQQHQNYHDQSNYQYQHHHNYEQNWNQNKSVPTGLMATSEESLCSLNYLFPDDPSDVPYKIEDNSVIPFSTENTMNEDEKPLATPTPETPTNQREKYVRNTELSATSYNDDNDHDGGVPAKRVHSLIEQQARKPNPPTRRKSIKDNDNNKEIFGVDAPTKFDILCGQSRICASHMGNRRFQAILDDFAPRYDKATSKQEKMTMTKEVVATIHHLGGRFLKQKDGRWEEISTIAARDKVSHALRTKVASWKRKQKQHLQREKADSLNERRTSSRSSKLKHRRGGGRSSASSISTSASDIVADVSFDGSDAMASESKVSDMLKSQRKHFARLTTPPRPSNATTTDDNDIDPYPLWQSNS